MVTVATDRLQGALSSLAFKAPVRVATTGNITLAALQTVDGVALVAGDRVLVKDQTSGIQNGVYNATTSTWTRAPDFDGNLDVTEGTTIPVNQGSTNAETWWRISTTGAITIGTTSLAFELAVVNSASMVNFLQAGAGAVTRTAQDKMRESVSVKDFGAVDDGVTDDAAAIQAAVDSLGTGGGTIYFPKPSVSYIIGTAIDLSGKSNIAFEGEGGAEWQTSNSTKLEAKSTLTGPIFTCDTANSARGGAFTFRRLHLDGNQQNVDGFYIHGNSVGNQNARFIKFEDCAFESLRVGVWLGDYTAENPNFTYLLGVDIQRCIFYDCVRPVVADAGGFDSLHMQQVWVVDLLDRMEKAVSILVLGGTYVLDSVWLACGQNVTHAVYSALSNNLTIRNCAIEANDASSTYTAIYMGAGASEGGLIVDNTRVHFTAVDQLAIDISNDVGATLRECNFQGNVKVGASTIVHADNVEFSSTYGYTTTPENVYVDGTATGTWTPTISFVTAGDLSVAYSTRRGYWSKKGKEVTVWFEIITSTFTHTTASGNLLLGNFTHANEATNTPSNALGLYQGITTAAGTDHVSVLVNAAAQNAVFHKSGSGQAVATITTADMPTAGTVWLYGQVTYRTTA